MGLRINTVLSMRAATQLQRTQKAIARSLERLGSGSRVNSPRDDAAAYRLGVGLTSQIRGIAAANLGVNTALGMIDTASAAISTQLDIIQRMREIAVQASNGTLSDTDRANLDLEVQTLYSEYNRITSQTNFNGTNLLDGSFGLKTLQAGPNKGDTIQFGIDSTAASSLMQQTTTTAGHADGTFQSRVAYSSDSRPQNVKAVDITGDGILDLVTANTNASDISILIGNGNGTFQAQSTLASGSSPTSVNLGDFNGDGKQDLLVTENGDAISIYLGNGNATFTARTTIGYVGVGFYSTVLKDFNGDGKMDVFGLNGFSTLPIFLGNGNGTFQPPSTVLADQGLDAASIDVSGDGKLDLIVTNFSTNLVSVYLGNGNATFAARTTYSAGTTPIGPAAADFNGDGFIDFAVSNESSTDTVSVFLGNGNGTFNSRVTYKSGATPNGIVTADFNGDGLSDLVTADYGANTLSVLFGNGNGTFKQRVTYATGSNPYSVIAADLNGDSVLDLVTPDRFSNAAGVYLGNKTANVTSTSIATVSVTTQTRAQNLITVLDSAISSLSSNQANLSAIHSRLNETVAGNLILSENLASARSVALDADFALETADLVKYQILQSAQIAVLTQANMQQDLILKLLENQK